MEQADSWVGTLTKTTVHSTEVFPLKTLAESRVISFSCAEEVTAHKRKLWIFGIIVKSSRKGVQITEYYHNNVIIKSMWSLNPYLFLVVFIVCFTL